MVTSSAVETQAQTPQLDSLKLTLINAKHDTTRCNILTVMVESEDEVSIWSSYNDQILSLCESKLKVMEKSNPEFKFFSRQYGIALNNLAYAQQMNGNVRSSVENYQKCIAILRQIGLKGELIQPLSNLALMLSNTGDIKRSLELYQQSLRLSEELGNKRGISGCLNDIASVFRLQGDVMKAVEYYNKSLAIREEMGDKTAIAQCLNNIGTVYFVDGDPFVTSSKADSKRSGAIKALEKFERSLKLREETGDKFAIAISLNNIAYLYGENGDPSVSISEARQRGLEKALALCERSLKIREEIGDKLGQIQSIKSMGTFYLKLKQYNKAIEYGSKTMKLSKEIGYPINIKSAADLLYNTYKTTGNHKLALENYELFIQMRDSINNESTRKASIKSQLKYEYEKQAAADSVAHAKESEIKNVELQRQSAEIKAKKNQQYALFGGLGLVIIFAGFMFNRFKVTQKQKIIIEHQKEIVEEQKKLVEEKQKEVLDSIRYAKRIQLAQIPSEKIIAKTLNRLRK